MNTDLIETLSIKRSRSTNWCCGWDKCTIKVMSKIHLICWPRVSIICCFVAHSISQFKIPIPNITSVTTRKSSFINGTFITTLIHEIEICNQMLLHFKCTWCICASHWETTSVTKICSKCTFINISASRSSNRCCRCES